MTKITITKAQLEKALGEKVGCISGGCPEWHLPKEITLTLPDEEEKSGGEKYRDEKSRKVLREVREILRTPEGEDVVKHAKEIMVKKEPPSQQESLPELPEMPKVLTGEHMKTNRDLRTDRDVCNDKNCKECFPISSPADLPELPKEMLIWEADAIGETRRAINQLIKVVAYLLERSKYGQE